jgi:anti-sigma factor RsiW
MHCDEAQQLISASIDGEVSNASADELREHTAACAACAGVQVDFRRLSQQLRSAGREILPARLESRVRLALSNAAGEQRASAPSAPRARPWLRQLAAIAAVCLIAVFSTFVATRHFDGETRIEHDVLSAHLRSLLQDKPIQVASGDPHSVKPWFNGRVEFSPEVKDPSAEGFPLVGARLDYIDGRRVAALVYKRRDHVVNVFVWPSNNPNDAAPRLRSVNGINLLTWRHSGLIYWAASDLNGTELQQLHALL